MGATTLNLADASTLGPVDSHHPVRELEIVAGDTRLVIDPVGARLAAAFVDGKQITEPSPVGQQPTFGNGIVMAPWPNRVRGGRWSADGLTHQLELTEPGRGNAIHGFVRHETFALVKREAAVVELMTVLSARPGWPFTVRVGVRFRAHPSGFAVTSFAINESPAPAPWAVGFHPYFRIGDVLADDLILELHGGAEWIELDEQLNPVLHHPVKGSAFDFRTPARLRDRTLNVCIGRFSGGPVATLSTGDGRLLRIWMEQGFPWLQVFTPPDFPSEGQTRRAIALEPMSAPPNALNTKRDLALLAPAERWEATWGVDVADQTF